MSKSILTAADAVRLAVIIDRIARLGEAIGRNFEAEVGPKFIRIVQSDSPGHGRHVHAFVDRSNGDLIKSAGWKAPAKGVNGLAVRGNLIDNDDFDRILGIADPYGSYLYAH